MEIRKVIDIIWNLTKSDILPWAYDFRASDYSLFRTNEENSYDDIANHISTYEFDDDEYTILASCPMEWYVHWCKDIEEPTPIMVHVVFKKESLDGSIEKLRNELETAWDTFQMYLQTIDEYNFYYWIR